MVRSRTTFACLIVAMAAVVALAPAPAGAVTEVDPQCPTVGPACWTSFPSLHGDGEGPVPGLVFLPASPNGKAIVYVHGGWGASVAKSRPELRAALEGLAGQGYVVVAPDYRGSGTPDGVTQPAGWKGKFDVGRGEVGDSAGAVAWVRTDLAGVCPSCAPITDVVVLGTSHGGGIVAGMAFLYPDLAEGYSVSAGVPDWEALYGSFEDGYGQVRNQLEVSMGGTPAEVPDEYRARSAQFNVERVQHPIQILYGLSDSTVPPSQSALYLDALMAAGKQVEHHAFPGGHNFMVSSQLESPAWLAFQDWAESVLWPDTTIGSGPPEVTNDPAGWFTFEGSRPGSTFECRVDGEADWTPCPSPHSVGPLMEGPHAIEVRASHDGEVDPEPATWGWIVDLTPPDIRIGSGPTGPTASTAAAFTFSSPEPGSTFRCRTDGGDWETCASPASLTDLSEGEHVFEVAAVDPAGNESITSRTWTVDTVAPDTTIDSAPPVNDGPADVVFTFSSPEPGSTFECRVDGGSFEACTSPRTMTFAEGEHTFYVQAVDAARNTGSPRHMDVVGWSSSGHDPRTHGGESRHWRRLGHLLAGRDRLRGRLHRGL